MCDKLTDAGLKELTACKQLRTLNVYGCNKITNEAVADLKKILPGCEVVHWSR